MSIIFNVLGYLADVYRKNSIVNDMAEDKSHLKLLDEVATNIQESGVGESEDYLQRVEQAKKTIEVRMERACL